MKVAAGENAFEDAEDLGLETLSAARQIEEIMKAKAERKKLQEQISLLDKKLEELAARVKQLSYKSVQNISRHFLL